MILRYIIPHCPYLVNDFNLIRHKELIDTDIPAGNFMALSNVSCYLRIKTHASGL